MWQLSQQHIDIRVKVLDADGLHWLTGVNATILRDKANASAINNVTLVEQPGFFAASRGLIRNSTNDLLDYRRYYTGGGSLSL